MGNKFFYHICILLFLVLELSACNPIKDNDSYLYNNDVGFAPRQRQPYNAQYYPVGNPPPYSGAYSNPYALPPRPYYQYYDYDQYYVPPAGYGSGNDAITKY